MSSSTSVLPPVNRWRIGSPVGGAVLGKSGARAGWCSVGGGCDCWRVEAGRRLAATATATAGGWRRAGDWGERCAGGELGRAAARLEGGGGQAAGCGWGERRTGGELGRVAARLERGQRGDGSRPVGACP
jgi:hypothetical protein